MDFIYLALLAALVALTWGFMRLCARLEEGKWSSSVSSSQRWR